MKKIKAWLAQEHNTYRLSILVLVITCIFSVGYHHFDEHFQLLEFASIKLGLNTPEELPWEYHEQMRPAFQPFIVYCLAKTLSVLSLDDPFTITLVLRLLSATLSFIALLLLYRTFKPKIKDEQLNRWFLFMSFFFWLGMYNAVRFSSEGWAASLFTIGLCLYINLREPRFKFLPKKPLSAYLLIGLILGGAFLSRYQAGFLIVGLGAWMLFLGREKFKHLFIILFGILVMFGVGVLLDRWLYGEWTLSTWNYLDVNILQDKAAKFGESPWYHYFVEFILHGIPPFSLALLLGLLYFIVRYRKSPLTWSIVPFLLIHFMIGHKELRFLFPVVIFLPLLFILSVQDLKSSWQQKPVLSKSLGVFVSIFFVVNGLLLGIVMFKPADTHISVYRSIYTNYDEPITLYYVDINPFDRIKNIHFYRRPNLELKHVTSLDSLQQIKGERFLVVLTPQSKEDWFTKDKKMVFQTYPDWVHQINYGGWIERSKAWYLYEVSN